MKYSIYTDGSTRANGSENAVGGWAYVIVNAGYDVMVAGDHGAEKGTTNQRMELQAAINGLKEIESMLVFPEDSVVVYTDSAYLHNCYQQKWYVNWQKNGWKNAKKQPVANQDLWEQLVPYFERWEIDFAKVKGHANNSTIHEVWNNYVDTLAQNASSKLREMS